MAAIKVALAFVGKIVVVLVVLVLEALAADKVKGTNHRTTSQNLSQNVSGSEARPSNMQWQTVAEARAKDKWERTECRK